MIPDSARTYAWNWFALHAGQRLQLVNFWLVSISFLAAAFVQSEVSHLHVIASGVSLVGAIASLAFVRLDARTRQLTRVAEDALATIERQWIEEGALSIIALVERSQNAQHAWLDSYRNIIEGLQLIVSFVFVGAFIYAVVT